jgi:hypothetical protein
MTFDRLFLMAGSKTFLTQITRRGKREWTKDYYGAVLILAYSMALIPGGGKGTETI